MDQKEQLSLPLVKFKTGFDFGVDKIRRVEVLRETGQFVYLPSHSPGKTERRDAKRSEYTQYHNTWAEAHTYLVQRAETAVIAARRSLELANAKLGNIKGMKPPKEIA